MVIIIMLIMMILLITMNIPMLTMNMLLIIMVMIMLKILLPSLLWLRLLLLVIRWRVHGERQHDDHGNGVGSTMRRSVSRYPLLRNLFIEQAPAQASHVHQQWSSQKQTPENTDARAPNRTLAIASTKSQRAHTQQHASIGMRL